MSNSLGSDIGVLERAIRALENVPEVGGIYDQQHSDTHMTAKLELDNLLKEIMGSATRYLMAKELS